MVGDVGTVLISAISSQEQHLVGDILIIRFGGIGHFRENIALTQRNDLIDVVLAGDTDVFNGILGNGFASDTNHC